MPEPIAPNLNIFLNLGSVFVGFDGPAEERAHMGALALGVIECAMRHPEWAQGVLRESGWAHASDAAPDRREEGMEALLRICPIKGVLS